MMEHLCVIGTDLLFIVSLDQNSEGFKGLGLPQQAKMIMCVEMHCLPICKFRNYVQSELTKKEQIK